VFSDFQDNLLFVRLSLKISSFLFLYRVFTTFLHIIFMLSGGITVQWGITDAANRQYTTGRMIDTFFIFSIYFLL
jgi:hypothetical protein